MATQRVLVQYFTGNEAAASVSIHTTLAQAIAGIMRYFSADILNDAYARLRSGDITEWHGVYMGMLDDVRVVITKE